MGIHLTHFDPAILDVPVDDEDEYEEEVQEGANDIRNEEVNTQDYDKIMEEARINLKGEQASRVGPRDEIFTKASVKGDNSENYLRQGQNHTRHSGARVTRACVYRRQKQTSQSYILLPQRMRKSNEKRKIRLNHAHTNVMRKSNEKRKIRLNHAHTNVMRKSNEKRKIRLNHAHTKGKNLEIC